jgi:hypothetical protein
MSKRRSDAWDATLSDEQRLQAFEWARNLGYHKMRVLLKKQLKIQPPSIAAISTWYQHMTAVVAEADLKKAITDADQIRDAAKELGDVSDAMAAGLSQLALEAMVSRDPAKIKTFVTLALGAQKERREVEELDLDKAKFQAAMKSNIERGLDALYDDIRGNAQAEKLFRKLRATVMHEVDKGA